MWATIRTAGPLIERMVTHRMALEEVSTAMDLQDTGECGKILLFPGQQEA